MRRLVELFDQLPLIYLLIPALMLGIAPWPSQPEPHLWEKLQMLFAGTLTRPIDIFDLFLHATPVLLVGLKLVRNLLRR
ncbi:MAG: RND transporter [Thiohalocapsa sp.]